MGRFRGDVVVVWWEDKEDCKDLDAWIYIFIRTVGVFRVVKNAVFELSRLCLKEYSIYQGVTVLLTW